MTTSVVRAGSNKSGTCQTKLRRCTGSRLRAQKAQVPDPGALISDPEFQTQNSSTAIVLNLLQSYALMVNHASNLNYQSPYD